MAVGNNTNPENTIRSEATWYAERLFNPSFIRMKLLPQMMDRVIKINQFKNPLLNR